LKRILITGAGGSPSTNFVRSLRLAPEPFEIVGTDADEFLLMRAETDSRYLVPLASDPAYLDVLNDIIDEEGVDLVHAQNDAEVRFLSDHRGDVHARTFLPSPETVRICQDKFLSYERWRAAGVVVPETVVMQTEADLQRAFASFGGQMWLRDATGAGGRGALPVHDLDTARSWLDLRQGWGRYTASELLEPQTITWMSIWRSGELILAQGRKRLYWELSKVSQSGVTGATGAAITVADPQVDKIAMAAVLAIDPAPNALFGVDLTYDRNGIPNPTEINIGRFFTTHLFFAELGVNMPYVFVKLACDEPLPEIPQKLNPAAQGMVWIRGMDFEPVLVPMSDIEARRDELARRRQKLRV
jgi:predicted ATP-grasp superfamily ATP-dependent carboligase